MPQDAKPEVRVRPQPVRRTEDEAIPITLTEAVRNYGTMAIRFKDLVDNRLPKLESDAEQANINAISACAMAREARDTSRENKTSIVAILSAIQKLREDVAPGGPVEQRAKQASGAALEDFASAAADLADAVHEAKTNPGIVTATGPHAPVTLEQLELREARAKAMVLEAEKVKRDAEADAKAAANRKFWRGIAGTVIAAVIVSALIFVWGIVKAQVAHDAGVAEGRSASREVAVAPTTAMSPPELPPPPTPSSVPASAQPHARGK